MTVQDLCHAHAQTALIQRKVQTIVDCFLNFVIAPELQIDIPIEMADKLMERLSGRTPSLHPYVFREAQVRRIQGTTTGFYQIFEQPIFIFVFIENCYIRALKLLTCIFGCGWLGWKRIAT